MAFRIGPGLRGVLSIGSGAAAGQVVVLGVSPLLSRLYSPESFGLLTIVVACAAVVAVVSTLRLETAVPLVQSDEEAVYVMATAFRSVTIVCTAVLAIIALFQDTLRALFDVGNLFPWFWFVPVLAWVIGCYEILSQAAVRMAQYGAIARRNFFLHAMGSCVQLLLAFTAIKLGGLVVGILSGRLLAAISLVWTSRTIAISALVYREGHLAARVLKPHWRYPVVLAPSNLLNILGTQAPFIFIGILYGSPAIGFLGFAYRIIAAPVGMVGQAISQVYVGQSATGLRDGNSDMRRRLMRVSGVLLIIACLLVALLVTVGPDLFALFFGSQWRQAGDLCRILAVAFGLQLIAVPVSKTLILKGKKVTQLLWDGCRAVAVTAAICIPAALNQNVEQTVFWFSAVSALSYGILWVLCFRISSAAVT